MFLSPPLGCVEGFNLRFRVIAGYPRWPAITLKFRLKTSTQLGGGEGGGEGGGVGGVKGRGGEGTSTISLVLYDANFAAGVHLEWAQVVSFYCSLMRPFVIYSLHVFLRIHSETRSPVCLFAT